MKELETDSVKILKSLKKDGFVVVKPICLNCLNELLQIVSEHYVIHEINISRITGFLAYVLYIKAEEFKEENDKN